MLIGGLGFAKYRERHGLSFEADKKLKASKAGFGSKSLDRAASVALVGFDRHSGEVLWKVDANHSFWHNGIVAGGDQIYCLDRNPTQVEEAMRRRGKTRPETYRIVALDYRTGKPQWEITDGIFGTWLGYSEEHDLLLQAGAAASDRLPAETGAGMAVYSRARWVASMEERVAQVHRPLHSASRPDHHQHELVRRIGRRVLLAGWQAEDGCRIR